MKTTKTEAKTKTKHETIAEHYQQPETVCLVNWVTSYSV